MITLTAKIDLISGNNGTLSEVTRIDGTPISGWGNNISSSIPLGSKKTAKSPFIIGGSILDGSSTFSDGVDYFIGNQLSLGDGNFYFYYNIVVKGKNITSLTIAFDEQNRKHPKKIEIDGVDYADDDAIFTVTLPSANEHTIRIDNWNAPNSPLVITGIYVDVSLDIDYRSIVGLERSIFDRADYKKPSYGIVSNGGNLEFVDKDGEIADYAEQLLLKSDLGVFVYLNNTLSKTQEKIAEFKTADWNYDVDNRSVSVSIKDDLEEWQDIIVDGISYDAENPNSTTTMEYFYNYLHSKTPEKYNMLPFAKLDEKTRNVIRGTVVKYPLLESGNLWQQWTKFCEVCALYIYQNNQKKTVCSYTYGS